MTDPFDWNPEQKEAALAALRLAEQTNGSGMGVQPSQRRTGSRIGVVGGGTMGAGISVAMLNAGFSVQLVERDLAAAELGKSRVLDILQRARDSGRIDHAVYDARESAFSASARYRDLGGADLVIEAVYEDLEVKREVFRQVSEACGKDVFLATNTSYLNPELIFEGVEAPERCIGLHFFSPANIMKLVEIIPLAKTSDRLLSFSFSVARDCGKVPVQAGICDGFIGNRILKTMRNQAEQLLLFGATPHQVDAALRKFGLKMGPFEVQDLAGLDIAAYQRQAARERGEQIFAPISDRLVAEGRLGRKSGCGWYDYDGTKELFMTPAPVRIAIEAARKQTEASAIDWTDSDIVEVVLFAMLDEAAQILAQGIARQPKDIDLVEVHGYGFPKDKGGLAWFGTVYGLTNVVKRLYDFSELGVASEPSKALLDWAEAPARSASPGKET